MTYEILISRCTYLDADRVVPDRIEPITHFTLGDAADMRHKAACDGGRISEETFRNIREFRSRMAEYDKKWGRR